MPPGHQAREHPARGQGGVYGSQGTVDQGTVEYGSQGYGRYDRRVTLGACIRGHPADGQGMVLRICVGVTTVANFGQVTVTKIN